MAIINGNAFPNILIGTNFADNINGFGGNDVLIGLTGNDFLNGGTGADTMVGGFGSDTYFVDNAGDVVAEGFNEGIDRILSSISLSLSAAGRFDVENLTLTGGAFAGVGNALGNQIVGTNFANNLNGLGGNDSLFGLGGNDALFGGTGSDLLNGGTGVDNMTGGTGNDIYVVDNVGDIVNEFAGGGFDRIISSISTSLNFGGRLNVENLTLTGTAITGIGNALANLIVGDNASNNLIGLAGGDRLVGGLGNDTLQGGVGNDSHIGGLGVDTIVTGSGFDTILFNAPLGGANADRVLDFNPAFDTILLDDAVFTGLPLGTLAATDFVIGAAAGDASDRIIYNSANGNLFFDADGTGATAQIFFADLASNLAMTNADFVVV
jgi:Ca2+-binding RTX toxin-like protein